MEQTKRCATCGCEVSADSQSCGNCGGTQFYATMVRCPVCGASVLPGQYCGQCGADLHNPAATVWFTCGNCGNYVHITHPNCMRCGAVLMMPKPDASQPPKQPTPQPPKQKKRGNGWLALLVIPILVLVIGLGIGIAAYLENELPQLNAPTITTGEWPTFSRPTVPKFPELTNPKDTEAEPTQAPPTKPEPTQPKPTEPEPTQPKPTQPKPTEPEPTQPKPTQPKPTEPEPTEPEPTQPESNIPDAYKDNHYLCAMGDGYCETMTGDVVVLFVFVTDPTDGWTATEQAEAEEALLEQLRTLLAESEVYGADLSLYYVFESVTVDLEFTRDETNWQEAAMKQLDLYEEYKDQRKLEEFYNADQVPVVFVVDEPGRSYAYSYWSGKGFESVTLLEKDYAAVRHELCHLFGARDMYFPQETVAAAKEYLPDGIMYGDCEGDIDPLTAFVIGWIDELTDEALSFLSATNDLTDEYIAEAKEQDQLTGYGTKYYDNGHYTGYMVVGTPHGEGTFYWNSGAIYTGSWVNGEREGKGTMTYDDGAVYKGDWVGSKREGKGTITYANGGVYSGDWSDDNRHGEGTYTWPDGAEYTGDWVDGDRVGTGTMKYSDGAVYTGKWKNDKRHGKGIITYTSGNVYDGEWKDNVRHGAGTYTWADGTVYTGDWSKDERTGEGTMTWPGGDKYVGQFKNGYRHGKGTYYYPNGSVYEGDWVDGNRTGKGTMTWADGSWYTGDFVENEMTGKGERYYASYGTRYVGDFVDGKRHGYGTFYYADGTTWTGYWENDVRVD